MRPQTDYAGSNVICADIKKGKIGSLNLLNSESLYDIFGNAAAIGVDKSKYKFHAANGTFDLCIMNRALIPASSRRGVAAQKAMPRYADVDGLPETKDNYRLKIIILFCAAYCR